jgi:hypothetical protein
MKLSLSALQEIVQHYYIVKNNLNPNSEIGLINDVADFFKYFDEPLFIIYFNEIVREDEIHELPNYYGLNYPVEEESRDNQTILTTYTNELVRIKEMYSFGRNLKMILDSEITQQFVVGQEEYFNFTYEQIGNDMTNILSTLSALHCQLTNNPIGYFEEKTGAKFLESHLQLSE